jgi:lipopolysaccharide transport system permease protein
MDVSDPTRQVIEPRQPMREQLRELWAYRELFGAFVRRQFLVRYRQTAIGVLWSVLRPLITMAAFTVVFHRVAGVESGETPYVLVALVGVLAWHFFAQTVTDSTHLLVNAADMIRKVYFPRVVLPAAACLTALLDMLVGLLVYVAVATFYGHGVSWSVLLFPVWVTWGVAVAIGPSLGLAALNVRYRDVVHVIPFVLLVGMLLSPVGYPSSAVQGGWSWAYWLNPMVSVIEGFRWSLLGGVSDIPWWGMGLSIGMGTACLAGGTAVFNWMQRTFADVI